jgi:hypothetical protein
VHSTPNSDLNVGTSEPGIGKVILRDVLAIAIVTAAIVSFYFFLKAFSILANIP